MRRFAPLIFVTLLTLAAASPAPARGAGLVMPAGGASSSALRVLNSKHYRIHTDLDRALAEDLARRMDAMYAEYARRLSNFNVAQADKRFDVYLFARKKDYLALTKQRMSNAGGVTIPELNIVAAYLEEQGRDALRSTLQHEAFHQFACAAIHPDLPPWLGEGLAVLFQEGIWTGDRFLLGQVPPRRLRQLQQDVAAKRIVPFRKMMSMTLAEWNAALEKDRTIGATHYNQAWAMCQFLIYADDPARPKYRAGFLDLLQRIHKHADPTTAFEQAFSPNIEGFAAKFLTWSKTLEATAEATLIERQGILADMLVTFAREDKRFDAIADFRDTLARGGYRMQYTSGDIRWTTDADPRIYFRTPAGQPYGSNELYFTPRTGAPLPDLVLDAPGQLKVRTRFHTLPRNIEHELLVEGAAR